MANEATMEKQAEDRGAEQTRAGRFFRPNVDILEKADELLLLADMPGVKSDSIDIHFEDGQLKIHGRVAPRYSDKANFLSAEYDVGDYYREFRVSEQIDASGIRAELKEGVLTLHLPKAASAMPRKIKVQAN
jgi:HSP20 family protein